MAASPDLSEPESLVARCDWLALATLDESGAAASSYVPFAIVESAFAIAVSRLAAHTRNLRARAQASVLLVDDASTQRDAFARPRLSVDVRAIFTERGSPQSETIWEALRSRLGETAAILQALPDFETLLLVPVRGRLILGFAAATDLDAPSLQAALATVAQRPRSKLRT